MPFRLYLNSKEHSIYSQTTTSAISSHSQSGLRIPKRWPRREAQCFRVRACFSAAPTPCNRLPVPRRECNSRKPFQEEPRPTSSQTIRSGEAVEKATRSLWSSTLLERWPLRARLCAAPRCLWRQIMGRFFNSPSGETINWGPLCAYACNKTTYAR